MRILFVIPGDINLPTGGYRYDRAMIEEWRKAGHVVDLLSLPGNYPFPTISDKQSALDILKTEQSASIAVVDGLAGGAHPEFLKHLATKMPVVALIHHPLCLESGLDTQAAKTLESLEAQGLQQVSGIVTTSPETSRSVQKLFAPGSDKIACVIPGVARGVIAEPAKNGLIRLLCVGSVIERKGHRNLLLALCNLQHLNWHLDCVGKTDFQPELYSELLEILNARGLGNRIKFHGAVNVNDLEEKYQQAHVFVLPSLFEGYGMVYAEAIVRGLPVIGTTAGAIQDTVPSECGILVSPNNIEELSKALETMISNHEIRENYRKSSLSSASNFPTWQESSNQFLTVLEEFL
ncbi:MAG: glycosyltransferase family 4 protein [Rhizobiaceae bacterium]